jgi:hypothetical protein
MAGRERREFLGTQNTGEITMITHSYHVGPMQARRKPGAGRVQAGCSGGQCRWAERGIALYSGRAATPEGIDDL